MGSEQKPVPVEDLEAKQLFAAAMSQFLDRLEKMGFKEPYEAADKVSAEITNFVMKVMPAGHSLPEMVVVLGMVIGHTMDRMKDKGVIPFSAEDIEVTTRLYRVALQMAKEASNSEAKPMVKLLH